MTRLKRDTFEMDGIEHNRNNPNECCGIFRRDILREKVHKYCGGNIHYQPIYGGIMKQCDKCMNTF